MNFFPLVDTHTIHVNYHLEFTRASHLEHAFIIHASILNDVHE